jgi:hypothetical protein
MRRTMDDMHPRHPISMRDIPLPIRKNWIVRVRRHHTIEIVIGHNLNIHILATRKRHAHRRHMMATMLSAALKPSLLCRHPAHHDVVDIPPRTRGNQIRQPLVHLGRARCRNRNISRSASNGRQNHATKDRLKNPHSHAITPHNPDDADAPVRIQSTATTQTWLNAKWTE